MTINCIIIDDEPLARKGLREYIADIDFLKLAGEFDTPLKAVELLNNGDIQLLFLDIQMPKITGLEFLKTIQHTPPVIFTTAYPQYALEGFELNALDYLVKPVSFDRFLKAAIKAKEYYEVRQKNIARENEVAVTQDYFFVKADNKLMKIFFDDVLFVEALQNYVTIHTKDRKYITYLTFKSVEEYLPVDKFTKTHKSYIVSLSKIDSIEGNEIHIANHHIPISRNEKDAFMEILLKGKFLKR
ncbi:MAG: DNA-binding response regulator [Chitinophagaceae bacterium]|nr:DNA-binding response regulator [Chitinophagaceae bacterium]